LLALRSESDLKDAEIAKLKEKVAASCKVEVRMRGLVQQLQEDLEERERRLKECKPDPADLQQADGHSTILESSSMAASAAALWQAQAQAQAQDQTGSNGEVEYVAASKVAELNQAAAALAAAVRAREAKVSQLKGTVTKQAKKIESLEAENAKLTQKNSELESMVAWQAEPPGSLGHSRSAHLFISRRCRSCWKGSYS